MKLRYSVFTVSRTCLWQYEADKRAAPPAKTELSDHITACRD